MRIERDSLGEMEIPDDAYWGINTARAVHNFRISRREISVYPDLIVAYAQVKQAAARANREIGVLDGRAGGPHRPRRPGHHRRRPPRPVHRRRHPGRGRDLHQHERQRGDRQPGARAGRPPLRRLRVPLAQRPRQPLPVHQRHLPQRGQAEPGRRPDQARRRAAAAAALLRGEGPRVPRGAQGGPDPAPGRGADDAGPGVPRLLHHAGRGHRPDRGRPAAADGAQPRRHGHRHGHHRPARLRAGGDPASARDHRLPRARPWPTTSSRPPATPACSCPRRR